MRSFYEAWFGIEQNSPIGIGELQSDLSVVTVKLQQNTEMYEFYRNVGKDLVAMRYLLPVFSFSK